MGVNAYRIASARPDYPNEGRPRPPVRQRVPARRVGVGENVRCDAPVIYDFDAPSALDDNDLYRPPAWLTDARATTFVYATIIAGMVIAFVLGFRR
jgi:hypothetical protein